jgi:hypothetical protein
MSEYPIPDEVKKFILEDIDSVAQLEALLLLCGNPNEEWSAAAVAKRLYSSEQETVPILARLSAAGLISANAEKPPQYRYQPVSPERAHMVERVATTYAKHLVPVTNLIHSKPRTRIQEFADAFKLRRED